MTYTSPIWKYSALQADAAALLTRWDENGN